VGEQVRRDNERRGKMEKKLTNESHVLVVKEEKA
jgi:hypothetical protein